MSIPCMVSISTDHRITNLTVVINLCLTNISDKLLFRMASLGEIKRGHKVHPNGLYCTSLQVGWILSLFLLFMGHLIYMNINFGLTLIEVIMATCYIDYAAFHRIN